MPAPDPIKAEVEDNEDAYYVGLVEGALIYRSESVGNDMVTLDYDEEGHLVGVEILKPRV